jgi:putative transposase
VPWPEVDRDSEPNALPQPGACGTWAKASRSKALVVAPRAMLPKRLERLDHAHQLASTLVRENQTISVEALNVRGLARSRGRNAQGRGFRTSVHDAGWAQFLRILGETATAHGRTVTVVSPAYTSRACSVCGVDGGPKPLHVRVWTCQDCETVLDRDYNAAVNIMIAAGHAVTACRGDMRRLLANVASDADPGEAGTTPQANAA